MAIDWFREPGWDEQDQAQFEDRLRRARSWNRPQYLRIKGLALVDAGELRGARDLFERVTSDHPDSLDAAPAREHLGDVAVRTGESVEAELHFRTLLADHPTLSATTGLAEVKLAEVLIQRGEESDRREAQDLLDAANGRSGGGLAFNNGRFRWFIAQAALASQAGDLELQLQAARAALDLVGREPQLPRHPTVGLVDADVQILNWLRNAAGVLGPRDNAGPWPKTRKRTLLWRKR